MEEVLKGAMPFLSFPEILPKVGKGEPQKHGDTKARDSAYQDEPPLSKGAQTIPLVILPRWIT